MSAKYYIVLTYINISGIIERMNQELANRTETNNTLFTKKVIRSLSAIALSAAVLAGTTGITGCSAQEKSSDPFIEAQYTADPDVTSVTIEEGARIRETPGVLEDEYANNRIEEADEAIDVATDKGITISGDTANGDWYGISVDDMQQADPDFDIKDDTDGDGTVWVNSQKAHTHKSDETANTNN